MVADDFDFNSTSIFEATFVIDRSSIEAFFFGGIYSMSAFIPADTNQSGIEIIIEEGDGGIIYVDELKIQELNKTVPYNVVPQETKNKFYSS